MNIPGYTIIKELGRGGMATVYLAEQLSLGRKVALKVMAPALAADAGFGERFLREARTAASLSHPGIMSVYDVGVDGHSYYIAMEYIPGGDLKQKLRHANLAPETALQITSNVAAALGHAHTKGFVHRDVKPENILFREDNTPVLADFGIAKATGSGTKVTGTGMSIGTPHYMSPEQARGQQVDGRSDLYSLGIVLYEMVTGQVPFEAEDSFAVAYAHINNPVPSLPGNLTHIQPLLERLLTKTPADRYSTAESLITDIDKLTQGKPLPAAATPKTSQPQAPQRTQVMSSSAVPVKRNSGLLWLFTGALLAVVLGGGYWLTQQPGTTPRVAAAGRSVISPVKQQKSGPSLPASYRDPVTGMEMVLVKGGCYQMGSNNGYSNEKPIHKVCIDGFYMGKYEVTQKQWRTIMGNNPSYFKGDNHPVEQVSWNDVQTFITRLNQKTGCHYRLPTEAEWEYGARGGQNYKYSGRDNVGAVAWYGSNSGSETHPVGQKQSNGFGLYDMSGNVWEWCQDRYGESYYRNSPRNNPQGPGAGSTRVLRGGCWGYSWWYVRSANRNCNSPGYRDYLLGFRLVRP